MLRNIYRILVVLLIVYAGWYMYATIMGNNSAIWEAMNLLGSSVVTFLMITIAFALVALSLGNIKWIPGMIRERQFGALLLHLIGPAFAIGVLFEFLKTLAGI